MVQAAGPAPVYIRVRQKTNRKKGILPPAWSPTFRPTRTGALVLMQLLAATPDCARSRVMTRVRHQPATSNRATGAA